MSTRWVFMAFTVAALLTVNQFVFGGEYTARGAEHVIKLGYSTGNLPPTESMEIMYGDVFKRELESRTDGKLFVEIYSSDSLGTAPDTLGAISVGSVEMGLYEIALFANYNRDTMLFNLPGKFRDIAEADQMLNSDWAHENIWSSLEKRSNLKVLGGVCKGFRSFTSKPRPLRIPTDIRGMSIRVMDSPMYVRMVESLSANPIVLAGSEMYTAMQNGVVDGHENTVLSVYQDKSYEVQDFMVLDEHIPGIQIWVMNAGFFNKLSPEYQKAIVEVNQVASEASSKVVYDLIEDMTNRLIEAGLQIYKPTAEEKAQWHAIYGPACERFLRDRIGDAAIDSFNAYQEKIRAGK